MSIVSSKMARVKMSPSSAARVVLARLRDEGRRIIDLTIGEPDFQTPAHICEAAFDAIRNGDTKYPLSQGVPALRRAAIDRMRIDTGYSYAYEEVIVSSGAKQVIFNALMASLDPGDEVIIPAPYWLSYPDMVRLAGGEPIIARSTPREGYRLQPESLAAAITPRTKWLMLNSPGNPSGVVYSEAELLALANVLHEHPHVWILTDDIYARLTFSGRPAPHLLQIAPGLAGRLLAVNGVSKAYAMTGWRIGYGAGPRDLIDAMSVIQSQSTSGASSISQAAALKALTGPQACVAEFAASYAERAQTAFSILSQVKGLLPIASEGAFYLFVDISGLLGRGIANGTTFERDVDVTTWILEQTGVAVLPGTSYGAPTAFRLSYAADPADVRSGCEAIRDALNQFKTESRDS